MSQTLSQMYKSVKISAPANWLVEPWCRQYINTDESFMVVKHVHGKKEAPHYHIVCVPRCCEDCLPHLHLDKLMHEQAENSPEYQAHGEAAPGRDPPKFSYLHPDRGSGNG
jgi:hypothetical protein